MTAPYIQVLNNKHFFHLWLGQITSQVALNMLSFVLAIRVYQETGSNTAVSLMLLSFAIPSVLFGIIAGGIVDFFDKRKVMLFCNIVRFFILLLFFLFYRQLVFLYILSVIISIVTQLFIPSEVPSIPALVSEKNLLAANSLFSVSFFLSTLAGFLLAGPMIKFFGNTVYIVMALFMLAASYFVHLLPPLPARLGNKFSYQFIPIMKILAEGIYFIKRHSRINKSLFLLTFSQALISMLAVLAPGFADKILTIELSDASLIVMGPAAAGLVIGALLVGTYGGRFLKSTIILSGIIICAVSLLFLSLLTKVNSPIGIFPNIHQFIVQYNIWASFIVLVMLGVSNSFINVPTNTILQEETEVSMRGRVFGVLTSATGGISLFPVIFSGIMADIIGVGATLSIIGFLVLFIGIYHIVRRKTTFIADIR